METGDKNVSTNEEDISSPGKNTLLVKQDGKFLTNLKNLEQNKDFYIVNYSAKEVQKVNVHVKEKHIHHWATYETYEGTGLSFPQTRRKRRIVGNR